MLLLPPRQTHANYRVRAAVVRASVAGGGSNSSIKCTMLYNTMHSKVWMESVLPSDDLARREFGMLVFRVQ